MDELTLVTSENFEDIECDIFSDGDDFYMTREQIGIALGYDNPRKTISMIHSRHKERLDNLSRGQQIVTPQGGKQTVVVYNRKGIMEICRYSDQPKANEFFDWVWNVMDALIKGEVEILPTTSEIPVSDFQGMSVKSKMYNAQVRKAREYLNMAKLYSNTDYEKILESYASEALSGEHLIPLPELDRMTYSATDIGKQLGITAKKVGILTNQNHLKSKEYGVWVFDIAKNTPGKQVQLFRYYDNIIPVLKKLLGQT